MTQHAFNAAVSITEDNHSAPAQGTSTLPNAQNIRDCVAIALEKYFSHLDGQEVFDVYEMVLAEIEAPLFEAVMKYTRKNQTKASVMLGLNRGTLRKKLKQYDML